MVAGLLFRYENQVEGKSMFEAGANYRALYIPDNQRTFARSNATSIADITFLIFLLGEFESRCVFQF